MAECPSKVVQERFSVHVTRAWKKAIAKGHQHLLTGHIDGNLHINHTVIVAVLQGG